MNDKIIAYKGFNADLTCRDFQFEVGKTYEHNGKVEACASGFHACTHPLDVFGYYPPAGSRFAIVEISGATATDGTDSKIAAARITIKAEIQLGEMIEAAVKAIAKGRAEHASATSNSGAASATGYRGAASATGYSGAASATGYRGAASATGNRGAASATSNSGAASATGYRGAASATGNSGAASATGKHSVAIGAGLDCRAQAAEGCALFLVERASDGEILHHFSGIAGRGGVNPMVWYQLVEGKLTAA